MISEVTFSKMYTSFWNTILINSRNYVKLVNGSLVENLYPPYTTNINSYNAYINILAFELFKVSLENDRCLFTENDIELSTQHARNNVLKFANYYRDIKFPEFEAISNEVHFIVNKLFTRYCKQSPTLQYQFPGLGLLNASEADLIYSETLVEIKSGERKFKIIDFRQILVYLTLNHFSKQPKIIKHIELFNPRMGISFRTSVEDVVYQLTATSSIEIFEEIQYFLCEIQHFDL